MRDLTLRDLAEAAGVSYRKAQRAIQSSLLPSWKLFEQDHVQELREAHEKPEGYLTASEARHLYGVSARQLDTALITTKDWNPPRGQLRRVYLEEEIAAFKPPGCIHAFALAAEEGVKRSWVVAMCKEGRLSANLEGNSWWVEDNSRTRMLIKVARAANEGIRSD